MKSTAALLPAASLLHLWLLFLAVFNIGQPALSGQPVEYLPGYNGKLPFKLETGYIGVANSTQFFYYFIESQGDPTKDPLLLWLSGGPGCSSLYPLVNEVGSLAFDNENFNGSLPTLLDYPYAWTKHASIIFLDSPVGTGFSYSTTEDGWASSDTIASKQAHQFLLKWLEENPRYLALQTYIAGDSYGGMTVPLVTLRVVEGLEAQVHPRVNLKGYYVGSPVTDEFLNTNTRVTFSHRMGLISDEIYKSAETSCNGNYVSVDSSNTQCLLALQQYEKCVEDISQAYILDPACSVFTRPHNTGNKRSLRENHQPFLLSPPQISDLWCRNFNNVLIYNWANDPKVRDSLHVRKNTKAEWTSCNFTLDYIKDHQSVIQVHKILTTKELHVLVDCGDRDMSVTCTETIEWVTSLNLTVDEGWRPWFVDGQVAGYTEKYYTDKNGYRMVFTTIKGAGHTAPEFKRAICYHMFDRWVHYYPL